MQIMLDFSTYLHTIEAVDAAGDAYTARETMLRKQFEEVFAPYRTMIDMIKILDFQFHYY